MMRRRYYSSIHCDDGVVSIIHYIFITATVDNDIAAVVIYAGGGFSVLLVWRQQMTSAPPLYSTSRLLL